MGVMSAIKDAFTSNKPREVVDGEKFYEAALAEQRPYHKVWFTNIAMVAGQQWAEWSSEANFLREPARDPGRVRITINLIKPIVRTWMAKVLRANTSFTGVPADTDEESQASARVASRLLEALYYEDKFRSLLKQCVNWVGTCGHGYVWVGFDKEAGGTVEADVPNKDTGQEEKVNVPLGKVVFDVTGPFETLMEPGADPDLRKQKRVMRLHLMRVEDIKDRWGVDVKPEKFESETAYWLKVRSLVDVGGTIKGADVSKMMEGMALVKEYFELPTREFPEGRHFMHANGEVIQETEALDWWEDDKRALPCGRIDDWVIAGRAYPASFVEDMIPPQVAFNRLNSAILEDVNRLGRGKVLNPNGAINRRQWTEEAAEIVDYTGPTPPEVVQGAQVNASHMQLANTLAGYIKDTGAMHDASLGKLPRRATSGKAIDLLTEADDARIGPTLGDIASCLERVGAIALKKMQEKYTEERVVDYVGANHQADAIRFRNSDLKGCRTVRVAMTPALSRGEKVSIGMELANMTAIPIQQALKVMELGDLNIVFDTKADQVNYAQMENMGLARGILHTAAEFEDHKAHADTHVRFLNSPTGQSLPRDIQDLFRMHIQEHYTLGGQNSLPGQRPPVAPPKEGGGAPAPGGDAAPEDLAEEASF